MLENRSLDRVSSFSVPSVARAWRSNALSNRKFPDSDSAM